MLERIINLLKSLIRRVTKVLADSFEPGAGGLSPELERFQAAITSLLLQYSAAAYMLGQGSPDLTDAETRAISDKVAIQVEYLGKFVLEIQQEEAFNNSWINRAQTYADSIQIPYWQGKTKMLPLPAMPGEGTQCLGNCRCKWRIEVVNAAQRDYNAYWELATFESALAAEGNPVKSRTCQTCRIRAKLWNPLRIRGGVLEIGD